MLKRTFDTFNVIGILKTGVLTIVLLLWVFASAVTAFFWTVFLVWAVFRLDTRIIGSVTLVFLIVIPILLALEYEAEAERLAVYVYFLITITVVLQVIEFIMTPRHTTPRYPLPKKIRLPKKLLLRDIIPPRSMMKRKIYD